MREEVEIFAGNLFEAIAHRLVPRTVVPEFFGNAETVFVVGSRIGRDGETECPNAILALLFRAEVTFVVFIAVREFFQTRVLVEANVLCNLPGKLDGVVARDAEFHLLFGENDLGVLGVYQIAFLGNVPIRLEADDADTAELAHIGLGDKVDVPAGWRHVFGHR